MGIHLLVLALAYYIFSHRPTADEAERRISATRQAATHIATAQRLGNLEEMERALLDSAGDAKSPSSDRVEAATPDEMLRQARDHYASIRDADRRIQAQELAELLEIPLHDAARRIKMEMPPLPPLARTAEPAVAQIAWLEAQARAALARRREYLRQRDAQRSGLLGQSGLGRMTGSGSPQLSPLESALARFEVMLEPPQRQSVPVGKRAAPVPPLDPGRLHTSTGRTLGPGGTYTNRLYVDTWYVLGPFEAEGENPLDTPYPPESAVDLGGAYAGKRGRTLSWKYFQAGQYPTYLPDPTENSIYYGYTELMLDRSQEVWAWIGADDNCKVWVNDQLVWGGGEPTKPWFFADARGMTREISDYNLTEGKVRLRLRKGRNQVLFKLHNAMEVMFFSLVLTDAGKTEVSDAGKTE